MVDFSRLSYIPYGSVTYHMTQLHTIWLQIFVVENFCNFRNCSHCENIIYKIFVSIDIDYYNNYAIDNSRYYRRMVSLASNNEFTQVFQAIVSVLHSLHHLRGVYSYSYIDRYRLRECTCRL